jgi:type VI protein secretion system component VasK
MSNNGIRSTLIVLIACLFCFWVPLAWWLWPVAKEQPLLERIQQEQETHANLQKQIDELKQRMVSSALENGH